VLRAAGRTRVFARVIRPVLPRVDARFVHRRRTLTSLGTGLPVLYLTATGRKSGESRTVALLYARADGDGLVVAASNWGRRQHPAWSANLGADPDITVTIDGVARPMRARRATAEELDRYWPRLTAIWPGYEGYRRRARREIRVFVLEPR
jgi:deazaflavin-dependent oxidoreductase (nitroreductase family)